MAKIVRVVQATYEGNQNAREVQLLDKHDDEFPVRYRRAGDHVEVHVRSCDFESEALDYFLRLSHGSFSRSSTMTGDEVKLAMRIIGLRKDRFRAKRNTWRLTMNKDREHILALQDIGLARHFPEYNTWALTNKGIQQLKQQIGEFTFRVDS